MRMQAGRSAYVPAALKRGKGRTGDSVFVQKMPVDPMNPKTLLEASCAYWCGAVRTSTASGHIGFAFPRVPTLTVIKSNLPLVPICGAFGDRFLRDASLLAVRS